MKIIYKISDLFGKLGNTLKFIGVLKDTVEFFNERFEADFPKDKRPIEDEVPETDESSANQTKTGKNKE